MTMLAPSLPRDQLTPWFKFPRVCLSHDMFYSNPRGLYRDNGSAAAWKRCLQVSLSL